MEVQPHELRVTRLGPPTVRSPLNLHRERGHGIGTFIAEGQRLLLRSEFVHPQEINPELAFERAGPREWIYFDPARTTVAIVTCGGLCPGLNNVIRSAVFQLYYHYGVRQI